MRRAVAPPILLLPLVLASLAGCGEAVRDDHFANSLEAPRADEPGPVAAQAVKVRIGELGPNFAACAAAGTTRHLGEGQSLEARAAPFDTADPAGAIPAGARFFVCSRSHDQRWLGLVWAPDGTLAPACGVSAPVASRRDYAGPCRSGWASAAFVKLVAG